MKKTLFCLTAAVAFATSAGDVNRKRDVIFYHYDVVPVLWPKSLPYSPEAIINGFQNPKRVMDGLSGKAMRATVQPDTFIYVPMPNFANLSAMVPSDEPQLNKPAGSSWMAGTKNILPEIKKLGKAKDPVSVMSEWVHKNNKEFFVGLCLNDNLFQSGYNPLKPSPPAPVLVDNYLFNSFKAKHLDWLMGSQTDTPPLKGLTANHPPCASWCLVDYNQTEVRAKFTAIAKEIIAGYEIDGLLLDFCRQPRLFRSVAWGGTASATQCQMITEMIAQISEAAKAKGCLLAVRVPDSQQACKDAGMDVAAWFSQKFVDLLFIGGTTELNRWSSAAEFAQKCGVPFYAAIDNSRIYSHNDEGGREDDMRMPRQCQEVYRARVSEARIAGAKGIMYSSGREEWWDSWWNYTNPELFQPAQDKIRLQNKRYFVNYRTRGGQQFIKDIKKYAPVFNQSLMTSSPQAIKGTSKYEIYVWDDFATLKKERVEPKCYLTTIIEIPSGWSVDVNINGKPLKVLKKRAGAQIYEIPKGTTLYGKNEIVLSVKGSNRRGLVPRIGNLGLDVVFNGEFEPLKKPGNVLVPQRQTDGVAEVKDAPSQKGSVSAKKGGRK